MLPELLVSRDILDEVGAEDPIVLADEDVGAVPLVDLESASKSSVRVYQGMTSHPMCSFRPWISARGARET